MTDPVTLSYAKARHRLRWKRTLAIILLLAASVGLTWRYGPRLSKWGQMRVAAWRMNRAFDAAAADLFPGGRTLYLPTADGPDAAGHLARLIAAKDAATPQRGPTRAPNRVHYVRTGTAGANPWMEFGTDNGSAVAVFRVVRSDRVAAEFLAFYMVSQELPADRAVAPSLYGSLSEPVTLHVGPSQGDTLVTTLRTGDTTNRLRWSWADRPSEWAKVTPLDGWAGGHSWWPQRTGLPMRTIGPPTRTIQKQSWSDLAFAPDGRLVLVREGEVGLMDPTTGEVQTREVAGLNRGMDRMLSPDGAWCYSWSGRPKGGARPIAVSTIDGRVVEAAQDDFHSRKLNPDAVFDGPRVLLVKDGKQVWRTDLETGKTVALANVNRFPIDAVEGSEGRPAIPAGPEEELSVSPNRRWVAGAYSGLSLYDWQSGRRVWGATGGTSREGPIVRWTDDGGMGSLGDSYGVCVWRLGEGGWVARWPFPKMEGVRAAISGDGRRLAALVWPDSLVIWDDLPSALLPLHTTGGTPSPGR